MQRQFLCATKVKMSMQNEEDPTEPLKNDSLDQNTTDDSNFRKICKFFSDNSQFRHANECFMFLLVKVFLLTSDVVSDITTGIGHISQGNFYWGGMTFVPITLPFFARLLMWIVTSIFQSSMRWTLNKIEEVDARNGRGSEEIDKDWNETMKLNEIRTMRWGDILWQLPLFQTVKNLRIFFALLLMDTTLPENQALKSKLKAEANSSGVLEAFLESAPQLILQAYIIEKTGNMSVSQMVSLPLSFLSLSSCSMMMFFSQRLGRYSDLDPPLKAKIIVFPFIVGQLLWPLMAILVSTLCSYASIYSSIIFIVIFFTFFAKIYFLCRATQLRSLYPPGEQWTPVFKADLDRIVNTTMFTSWMSSNTVLANDAYIYDGSKLISVTVFFKLNIMMLSSWGGNIGSLFCAIIFDLIARDQLYSPMLKCYEENFIQNFSHPYHLINSSMFKLYSFKAAKLCWKNESCHDIVRLCNDNEGQFSFLLTHLVPLMSILLTTSLVSTVCLQKLASYRTMYKWSKAIFCGKPVVHYTLYQDAFLDAETSFKQIFESQQHDPTVLNLPDPLLNETCLHILARKASIESSLQQKLTEWGVNFFIANNLSETPEGLFQESASHGLASLTEEEFSTMFVMTERHDKNLNADSLLHRVAREKSNLLFFFLILMGGQIGAKDRSGKTLHGEVVAAIADNEIQSLQKRKLFRILMRSLPEDDLETLMFTAIRENRPELCTLILESGVNAKCREMQSHLNPLELANSLEYVECTNVLSQENNLRECNTPILQRE